ncbi:MAG: glycosyltransferase family 2 protein [Halioglobus sp.]|nr:glycosyltransferase family 2 protein [Halioglobus sp.]
MPNAPDYRVAICVCTHSRAEVLKRLLFNLRDIELGAYDPAAVELIVIDNNPNAATRDLCVEAGANLPINVHYTTEPEAGVTHARNRAVAVALERGAQFLAFIDDDDVPLNDWLLQLIRRQQATGADLVFGSWILDEQMPDWARDSGIFRSPDKNKRDKKGGRYGLPQCASTCNLLVGRQILLQVGAQGPVFSHAFCNSGGEDKDFFIRAHKLGARLASAEQSVVHRIHGPERYTARGLIRRGFKNGCSQVNMARNHGDGTRRLKLLSTALGKILLSLMILPFSIFSRKMFSHSVYRIAKAAGVLYTTLTGRSIHYYTR